MIAKLARACGLCGPILVAGGCWHSSPDAEQRTAVTGPPRAEFELVSSVLSAHCGTLDCHGSVARNMRVYGTDGLRLAPTDVPGVDGGVTTFAEHEANYQAVVNLEPELMTLVVRESGRDPTRLTLIRKARSLEYHAGGEALPAGSDGDRCVTSWLSSAIDLASCERGALIARPLPR